MVNYHGKLGVQEDATGCGELVHLSILTNDLSFNSFYFIIAHMDMAAQKFVPDRSAAPDTKGKTVTYVRTVSYSPVYIMCDTFVL